MAGSPCRSRAPPLQSAFTWPHHLHRESSLGLTHFGFRLVDASDIDLAVREVERAGGTLLRRGEFSPGFPYAYVADPDGYEIEIWFE